MPPMSMDEIIEKLNELFDKINRKIEEIRSKVNSILSHVPVFLEWAVDKFLDAWDRMLAKLEEFWNWFTDKLEKVGDPVGLWNKADDWHTLVGDPGKRAADSINEEHELLVNENWTGTAAQAYTSKVTEQETQMRLLGTAFASPINQGLKTLAGAIGIFWAGIIAAVIALVSCIIAASAATGTIIGLPAVPVLIVSGVVAFLVAAGIAYGSLRLGIHLSANGFRNAIRYTEDWPAFAF